MPKRVTLRTVNDELARLGHDAILAKGGGYFYFTSGETEDWLDRTVRVPTLNALTMGEWVGEFRRLKKLNEEIMVKPISKNEVRKRSAR